MAGYPVFFDGFDLSTITNFEVDRRFPHELPERNLNSYGLARVDGEKLTTANFRSKNINIDGHIYATTRAGMETARDTLVSKLLNAEGELKLDQAGSQRKYQVTCKNVLVTVVNAGLALVTLTFQASDPFGYALATTTITFTNPNTLATKDTTHTFTGSYDPEVTLGVTIGSLTGGTTKTVSFTNPVTSQSISITRTWSAGDVVAISVANKTVTVNGTAVDYAGLFPYWRPGSGTIRYTDDFTTRSVTLSGSYVARYL